MKADKRRDIWIIEQKIKNNQNLIFSLIYEAGLFIFFGVVCLYWKPVFTVPCLLVSVILWLVVAIVNAKSNKLSNRRQELYDQLRNEYLGIVETEVK